MDLEGIEYQNTRTIKRKRREKEALEGVEAVGYRKIKYTPKQALRNKLSGIFMGAMENAKSNSQKKGKKEQDYTDMLKGNILGMAKKSNESTSKRKWKVPNQDGFGAWGR